MHCQAGEARRHEEPSPVIDDNEKDENKEWKQSIALNTKTYVMAMDAWIIAAGIKAKRWYSEQRLLANGYKQLENNGHRWEDMSSSSLLLSLSMEDKQCFLEWRNDHGGGTNKMECAISLLQEAGQDDVHATVVGYNTLFSGWAKLANPLRLDVLLKLEAFYRK